MRHARFSRLVVAAGLAASLFDNGMTHYGLGALGLSSVLSSRKAKAGTGSGSTVDDSIDDATDDGADDGGNQDTKPDPLDVDGDDTKSSQQSALAAKLREEAEHSKRLRQRAQKAETELKRYKDAAPDINELAELRKLKEQREKDEAERKKREGRFEEILKDTKEQHEKALRETEERAENFRKRYHRSNIHATICAIVPQHTGVPVDDIEPLIEKFFKFDEETENITVLDRDLESPRINKTTGKPYTPEEFIADWINSKPHYKAVQPKNGTGGINRVKRGTGEEGFFTEEDVAKMTHEEFKKNEPEILRQMEVRRKSQMGQNS